MNIRSFRAVDVTTFDALTAGLRSQLQVLPHASCTEFFDPCGELLAFVEAEPWGDELRYVAETLFH